MMQKSRYIRGMNYSVFNKILFDTHIYDAEGLKKVFGDNARWQVIPHIRNEGKYENEYFVVEATEKPLTH